MHITDLVIWSITCFFIPDMHIYYITFWVLDPSQGFRVAQADPARSIQTSVSGSTFVILLLKWRCCVLVFSAPAICLVTTAVGSGVRPSDKVEGTCWLFSSNKELLIAAEAAAVFQCKRLFFFFSPLHILSPNLSKSACPCSLCEHVTVCGR